MVRTQGILIVFRGGARRIPGLGLSSLGFLRSSKNKIGPPMLLEKVPAGAARTLARRRIYKQDLKVSTGEFRMY